MKKRLLLLAGLVVAGGALAWIGLNWYTKRDATGAAFTDKDFVKASKRLNRDRPNQPEVIAAAPISPSRPVRLAIGWLGLPDEAANLQVADLLTAELSGAKGLELVERQSLDRVLGELELNLAGLVRAKDAVRVGKLLKAEWFLLGNAVPAGVSNAVIARIVDAQTGVVRDAGVFPGGGAPALAAKLGEFVRGCRQAGGDARPHVFLAVGTFRDFSLNNRLAEFPAQLRAQLIEAYQGSGVTLLEREYVEALLQEVRLDLAGLTETGGTALPRMQSAFWLVDGSYQSYETSGYEVELGLNIRRIFGRPTNVLVRAKPGPALFTKAKAEIDRALSAQAAVAAPTRVSEAVAQMDAGKELFLPNYRGAYFMQAESALIHPMLGVEDERQRRNLEEAVRAFQTVLLLEPTNRAAKMYLAGVLRTGAIGREDEARAYYREVLDEPVKDRWVVIAQQALNASLRWADPEEKARWMQPAALQATNPSTEFFQRESRRAAADAVIQRGDGPKARELAETRLLETIATFDAGRWYQESIGMDDFAETFGADRAAAARRLVELYPKMTAQAPNSAPYLLAAIVTFQVDTNAPVIAEFEQALGGWAEHPEKLPKRVVSFWNHVDSVYRWSQQHKLAALSAKILDAKLRANGTKPGGAPVGDDEDKMELAYGHKAAGRWQDALKIFDSYARRPIQMGGSGPWGRAFTVVLPGREAAECRRQLGLPPVQDPREFDLGKPVLCLHAGGHASDLEQSLTRVGAVAAAADGLWIGLGGKLLRLDFNLKTNLVVALPMDADVPITCLCLTPSEIWIGTHGAGLIGCDLASHRCVQLTEKEGLLMSFISSLHPAGDTLWIGYGGQSSGGLGKLDLRTRKATSFTPSLGGNESDGQKPPRVPVRAIASGVEDDLWFVAQYGLRRYRRQTDQWEAVPGFTSTDTLVRGADDLFVGMGYQGGLIIGKPAGPGLSTLSLKGGQWRTFPKSADLPTGVTALAVDGSNLWVAGKAYLALVDPAKDKVLRFAYVSARSVNQIQVGGGCVWAQCDKHLHKASLAASR